MAKTKSDTQTKLNVRRGDKVRIIAGKDKGKDGKVLRAYPATNRVMVEGANMIKKHTRPSTKNQQGGIMTVEGTIDASNVMLICPVCGEPTRVGHRRDDGQRIRFCKKCDKDIDR